MVIGAFFLVRLIGPLPAVVTLGLIALVWSLSQHKPALVRAGGMAVALLVGLGFTFFLAVSLTETDPPQERLNVASAAPATGSMPSQPLASTSYEIATPPANSVSQPNPLGLGLVNMSDEAYLDGINRWLAAHPELEDDLSRQQALVEYMQTTLAENPAITLGASLDESLRRLRAQEQVVQP